jgi:hypothetical protein
MSSRAFVPALLLAGAALALVPTILSGQAVPVSNAFPLCHEEYGPGWWYFCGDPDVTTLSTGGFAIASDWNFYYYQDEEQSEMGCRVDFVDVAGRLQDRRELEDGREIADYMPHDPFMASDGEGGIVTAWSVGEYDRTDAHVLSLGPSGGTRWGNMDRFATTAARQWVTDVAANAAGRSVVAWLEATELSIPFRLAVQAFDAQGQGATPVLLITPDVTPWPGYSPRVGMDREGRFVVVWGDTGQRFGRDGRLLGSRFQIGFAGSSGALAMRPDGSFVVARSLLQWFTREGVPSGLPREVAPGSNARSVALDRHGNIALLSEEGQAARLRLFNRDLVPQGPPRDFPLDGNGSASVALADSGRLLVAWMGPHRELEPYGFIFPLLAQVWQARHNADPCVVREGRFLCDTAGDGGAAEASIAFGQAGDVSLLADWDGDGRADPCVYRAGRFLCDTAHDGGAPETRTPRLGVPGDQPLLADVNGDGRADACLRRGRSFLCDLDRNGTLETRIDFGKPPDVPLLADVNGDHRADPCVERAGLYLCDTAHNGGTAEVIFDLNPALAGIGAGVPLLGDVDVDGNGRADACLWSAGRLVCGFFDRQGGVPQSVLDLAFGQPGDVPLLGDLDAF